MIFAIDPGSVQSGWVHYEDGRVLACGVDENEALLLKLLDARMSDELVIEMMKARGMPVSNDEMRTLVWIGRFQQQWHKPSSVRLVYRVKVEIPNPGLELKAGMPAEVFIQGEQRTPLQYLAEPVTQVLQRAGRER